MWRVAFALVLACGGATPVRPIEHHAPAEPAAPWRYRMLELGSSRHSARRTAFELVIEGDRATLVEAHSHAAGSYTLDTIDRASWLDDGKVVYTGARKPGARGMFELDLAAAGVQPLHLVCRDHYARLLAPAGEPRLPVDCAGRLFGDAHLTFAMSRLCGGELPEQGDDDDADQLTFAPSPGVERLDVNDGCDAGQVGLRLAR